MSGKIDRNGFSVVGYLFSDRLLEACPRIKAYSAIKEGYPGFNDKLAVESAAPQSYPENRTRIRTPY